MKQCEIKTILRSMNRRYEIIFKTFGVIHLVCTHKGGRGVKQKCTPCVQGGGELTNESTYAKTFLFCTCFVIFSYAGSFYHTLLSLA